MYHSLHTCKNQAYRILVEQLDFLGKCFPVIALCHHCDKLRAWTTNIIYLTTITGLMTMA